MSMLDRLRLKKQYLLPPGLSIRRIIHAYEYGGFDYRFLSGYSFPPKSVCLIPSEHCNLHCVMCDIGQHDTTGNQPSRLQHNIRAGDTPLSLAEWKQIIHDLALFWPRPLVLFTGTEPLLYPDIIPLIAEATCRNVPVHITTNGTLLSQYAEEIVALCHRPDDIDITVSIDDIGSRHDALRGVPGTFDRAIQGINAVAAARRSQHKHAPFIHITCTVTAFNQDHLEDLVKWFIQTRLPITGITFNHVWFKDNTIVTQHNAHAEPRYQIGEENCSGIGIREVDSIGIKRRIAMLRQRYRRIGFRIHEFPPLSTVEASYYYTDPCRPVFYDRCTAAWRNISITPRGNVILSPLCFLPPVGNVREQPLRTLWNAAAFRDVRRMMRIHKMFPACTRCCMLFGSRPKYYKLKEWVL
ncbi:MAG: radical SAM protein [Desulfobacterota bacterium]|nr:radical SAM protein [Thermodesulfobacteriota bacterium]